MLKGFREFLLRGNVIDLAVAVVIGTAFGAVVTAFATDFIGGLIGAVGGTPDFGNAGPTVNDSKIVYGSTVNTRINFLIVAAVIYFVIAVPMRELSRRRGRRRHPGAVRRGGAVDRDPRPAAGGARRERRAARLRASDHGLPAQGTARVATGVLGLLLLRAIRNAWIAAEAPAPGTRGSPLRA